MSPSVSILIPARNEEKHIENIIEDACAQNWHDLEILILNDHSEDKTADIIKKHMQKDARITMIEGAPLPSGWTGKNWACHQLAKKSSGSFLIFIDADCRISPWLIKTIIAKMEKYGLDMLSSFPFQVMKTPGEYLTVPLMNWLLMTFLPLRKVYTSKRISFVAANGQLMAFTRSFYNFTGGHESVASMPVEDMELARICKRNNGRIMTLLGGNGISCRMYTSFKQGLEGFTKNFYPGFNISIPLFSLLLLFIEFFFLAAMAAPLIYKPLIAIPLIILLERFINSLTEGQNTLINLLLHPVHMIILAYIGIVSMYKTSKGTITWKGRNIFEAKQL